MAEILVNTQSPVSHQIFWNGDVGIPTNIPTAKLFDVTEDPAISPSISPTTLLETLTSVEDENNPGVYTVYIPFQYTDRNRHLRLKWEYYIDSKFISKLHDVFVVTPYVDFSQASGQIEISADSSDPNYKSFKDLVAAERYARKQIESYTGQKFYLYDDVEVVYGYESDILPLSSKIQDIHELYENDILLLDNINQVNNLSYSIIITESGYGIRVDRNNIVDNTVYTANGMVPPSIHDSYGVFKSNVPYRVQGRFGWESVPDEVELATIELMKDYFNKDILWRNKYIKSISTFDWDFEYDSQVHGGTGNAYVDKLLERYVISRVEIL